MDGETTAAAVSDRRAARGCVVLVVLVADAELACVAVALDQDDAPSEAIAPALRLDDVLSFIRRRIAPACAGPTAPHA